MFTLSEVILWSPYLRTNVLCYLYLIEIRGFRIIEKNEKKIRTTVFELLRKIKNQKKKNVDDEMMERQKTDDENSIPNPKPQSA